MRLVGWSALFLIGLLGCAWFAVYVVPFHIPICLGIAFANPTVPPGRLPFELLAGVASIVLLVWPGRRVRALVRRGKRQSTPMR